MVIVLFRYPSSEGDHMQGCPPGVITCIFPGSEALFIVAPMPLSPFPCGLEFKAKAKGTGIIVELVITDHGPEVHKWLPTVRQNRQQPGSQIEIVAHGRLVLKRKACGGGPLVFSELHGDMTL